IFPFTAGAPADFPASPFRYDVRVTSAGSGRVQLFSTGLGRNGATKVIQGLVARAPLPFTPGAVYVQGDTSRLDMGSGGFMMSGLDHAPGDAPSSPTGTAAPVPGLAVSNTDAEGVLREGLGADTTARLLGKGGTPSIATTAPLDLQ